MRNLWLRFGCFLTGYNYRILKLCSEASSKSLLRYTAAMLIIMIIWAFVGYSFSIRYIQLEPKFAAIGASIAVFIVIQIERQIILAVGRNSWAAVLRGFIALVMAILGSVITDQIIFKDDVELAKIAFVETQVDSIFPTRSKLIDAQIASIRKEIEDKEQERVDLLNELAQKPVVKYYTTSKRNIVVGDTVRTVRDVQQQDQPNPKADYLPGIDTQIQSLRTTLNQKENTKITLRKDLETEFKEKVGFLDELKLMMKILLSDWVAMAFWILLFSFFLGIELFVLVSKLTDTKNDYDKTVQHQMDIHLRKIEALAKV